MVNTAPKRFRVSFGAEKLRFNEKILIENFQIDVKQVLHIVDEGTGFSAVRFFLDLFKKTIW